MSSDNQGRAVDVVGLYYSDTLDPVLFDASPMSANVYEDADLMEHPLEDGAVIADHIVFKPTEIDLPLRVTGPDPTSVLDGFRQLFRGGERLTVQTRAGVHDNMVISAMPHDETPEAVDAPMILLRLRQARFIEPEYGQIQNARAPRQTSTAARGQQQTRPGTGPAATAQSAQTQQQGSTLYRIFNGSRS